MKHKLHLNPTLPLFIFTMALSIFMIALVLSPFTPSAGECTSKEHCYKDDETTLLQTNVNIHKPTDATESFVPGVSSDTEMVGENHTEDDEAAAEICGDNIIKVANTYYRRTNAHVVGYLGNVVIKDSYAARLHFKKRTSARVMPAEAGEHWLGQLCSKAEAEGFLFKDAEAEDMWPFSSSKQAKNAPAPTPPMPKPDAKKARYIKNICSPRSSTFTITCTSSQERALEASVEASTPTGQSGSISGSAAKGGSKEYSFPFELISLSNTNTIGELLGDPAVGGLLIEAMQAADANKQEQLSQILTANQKDTKHGWHAPGWMRSMAGGEKELRDAAKEMEVGVRFVTQILVATADTKEVEGSHSTYKASASVKGINTPVGGAGGSVGGSTSSSSSQSASMGKGTPIAYALQRIVDVPGTNRKILTIDDPCDQSGDGATVNYEDCKKCKAFKSSGWFR